MSGAARFLPLARRVPVLLQQQRAECGLVALGMVAAYHGKRLGLAELRRLCGAPVRGQTLADLATAAARLELVPRALSVPLEALRRLRLPAVLHWRMDHFVVLTRAGRRRVTIHDPARGRRRIGRRELDRAFTGIALELQPEPGFVAVRADGAPGLRDLVSSVRGYARYAATMLALLLTTQLLALVPPVAMQLLVDEIVLGQQRRWLMTALAGLGAVLLAAMLLEAWRRRIAIHTGACLGADWALAVVRHLYRLPVTFHRARHAGDLMSKVESLRPLREALTDSGINGVVQLALLVSTLALMWSYDATLALIAVGGLLLGAAPTAVALPATRRAAEEGLLQTALAQSSLLETLRGIDVTRALALEQQRVAHWQRHFLFATDARVRQARLGLWGWVGAELAGILELLLFLGAGIGAVLDRDITLGVLFAFMTLRNRLQGAAAGLGTAVRRLALLRPHLLRLNDIVGSRPEPLPTPGIRQALRGSLLARGLGHRYSGGPWLFRDLELDLPAAARAVITGRSGCGKTTLLRLLAGLEAPVHGTVLVDGIEQSLWDAAYLRCRSGIVLQDERLFQGTVADNISAFAAAPDLARMRTAAELADVWDDILALPMQHRSPVGEGDAVLSGGQRQRIVLARALYRRPRLLFLDEATSQLDVACERRVLRRLATLGITVVSVAHRPEVVRQASHVIDLGRSGPPGREPSRPMRAKAAVRPRPGA